MDKKKSVLERLRALKGKELILAVLVMVVMIVIYFSSLSPAAATDSQSALNSEYCEKIENELIGAVKKLSGDDDARMAISWESGVEKILATETSGSNINSTSTVIVTSNGSSSPYVVKEIYPNAVGAIVVAKLKNGTQTKLDLIMMISTILDISPEKVAVYNTN